MIEYTEPTPSEESAPELFKGVRTMPTSVEYLSTVTEAQLRRELLAAVLQLNSSSNYSDRELRSLLHDVQLISAELERRLRR